MQLRAVTKPTDANFVRVIRKKVQSIKVITNGSIGKVSLWLIVLFPFETSSPGPGSTCIERVAGGGDQQERTPSSKVVPSIKLLPAIGILFCLQLVALWSNACAITCNYHVYNML